MKLPTTPSFRLDNKTALITGASSGLGLGCAVALAEAGAHVVLAARNSKNLNQAVDAINEKKINGKINVNEFFKLTAQIKKKFPNQVGLLHGKTEINEKEVILDKFLKKDFKILVSTTIIEVGIDFPNANVIVIEAAYCLVN